jgi:hypothetical protein
MVIEIRDQRSGRRVFVTTRSASHLRSGWTSQHRAAAQFEPEEAEEEAQFWRGLIDDPEVEVSAVE